ncbi:unnamed protein product [Vitrella brassicaformis CCMP3155]|uniref:AP2/ERF domain-containing protein n=1 Tax=Vitrella brassicaformis (strain CCMP3155) TaxID=1169540 RepID=A0A0G4F4C7_VITBC|nr:unnamed protein product [Vitrella brassicaformis CCMP3155]|eukprot:CEM06594.1 unnamed protein product [Vitrella brassicaformis CCMP3155]
MASQPTHPADSSPSSAEDGYRALAAIVQAASATHASSSHAAGVAASALEMYQDNHSSVSIQPLQSGSYTSASGAAATFQANPGATTTPAMQAASSAPGPSSDGAPALGMYQHNHPSVDPTAAPHQTDPVERHQYGYPSVPPEAPHPYSERAAQRLVAGPQSHAASASQSCQAHTGRAAAGEDEREGSSGANNTASRVRENKHAPALSPPGASHSGHPTAHTPPAPPSQPGDLLNSLREMLQKRGDPSNQGMYHAAYQGVDFNVYGVDASCGLCGVTAGPLHDGEGQELYVRLPFVRQDADKGWRLGAVTRLLKRARQGGDLREDEPFEVVVGHHEGRARRFLQSRPMPPGPTEPGSFSEQFLAVPPPPRFLEHGKRHSAGASSGPLAVVGPLQATDALTHRAPAPHSLHLTQHHQSSLPNQPYHSASGRLGQQLDAGSQSHVDPSASQPCVGQGSAAAAAQDDKRKPACAQTTDDQPYPPPADSPAPPPAAHGNTSTAGQHVSSAHHHHEPRDPKSKDVGGSREREGPLAPSHSRERTSSRRPIPLADVLLNKGIPGHRKYSAEYEGVQFSVAGEGDGLPYVVTAWWGEGGGTDRPPVWVRAVVARDDVVRGWDTSMLSDLLVAVRNGTADTDDRFESVSDVIDGVERTLIQWKPARESSFPGRANDAPPADAAYHSYTPPVAGGAADASHDGPHDDKCLSAKKASRRKPRDGHKPRSTARAGEVTQPARPTIEEAVDRSPSLEHRLTRPLGRSPPADEQPNTSEGMYQSNVRGVHWRPYDGVWQVSWYEKSGRKFKHFSAKEHGVHKAKALAERHRQEMERTGQASMQKRSEHQSGVRGVHYNKGANAWEASWSEGGKRKFKSFSVKELGYEEAKQAAISHRRAMELRHHTSEGEAMRDDGQGGRDAGSGPTPPRLSSREGRRGAEVDMGGLEGGGMTGDALARGLLRRLHEEQPNLYSLCLGNGGIGITWRATYVFESYFWDGQAATSVDPRQFSAGQNVTSRAAIFTAFRRAVEYRNTLHESRLGDQAVLIDLSWLEEATREAAGDDNRPLERHGRGARRMSMPPPLLLDDRDIHPLDGHDRIPPPIQAQRRRGRPSHRVVGSDGYAGEMPIDRPGRDQSGGGRDRFVWPRLSEGAGHALAERLVSDARQQVGNTKDNTGSVGLEWHAEEASFVAYRPEGGEGPGQRVFRVSDITSSRLILRAFTQAAQHCNAMADSGAIMIDMRRINLQPDSTAGAASGRSMHYDNGASDVNGIGDDDMDRRGDVSSSDGQPRRKAAKGNQRTVVPRAQHQSAVSGVYWSEQHQAWIAKWYEKSSGNEERKTFYVKEHGFDKAKALAEQHRLEMERSGRAAIKQRSEHQSGVKCVTYNKTSNSWEARWKANGKEKTKFFSVKQLGYEEAKQAAISHKRAMELRHHTSEGEAMRDDDGDDTPDRQGPSPDQRPGRRSINVATPSDASQWRHSSSLLSSGADGGDLGPDPRRPPRPRRKRLGVDPKRPRDRRDLTGLGGEELARAMLERLIQEQSSDFCPQGNGGIGISLHKKGKDRYYYIAYFSGGHCTHLDRQSFAISDITSLDSILEALRQAAEYRNAVHQSRLGDQATAIDLSWLDRQQGGGREGPEGSVRDESDDRSPPQKHRRRDPSATSSPSAIERPLKHRGSNAANAKGKIVGRKPAEHQSDVRGVYWNRLNKCWIASWYEAGGDSKQQQRKSFSVTNRGFDKAKALAEQHRREMERSGWAVVKNRPNADRHDTSPPRHPSRLDRNLMPDIETSSRLQQDPQATLPTQRTAVQLHDGGVRGRRPATPNARHAKQPRPRRDNRLDRNPSPDIEAPIWLRNDPPATPIHRTPNRGPRVTPVQQGDLIRHFYQQLEALGRAHPDTPLCLQFRSGSALTQLAVEVVLPGTPVQSVPLSAATRDAMGAAIDAAWACRQQEIDSDGTQDQQPMTHAQRMALCRLYGQVGDNIGAMLAAVPSLSFASVESFVRHELPAMVGQRDGEDIREAANRFIHQLGQQHTTPPTPKRLKAADDEQLPAGDEPAHINVTMPPPRPPVNDPHAPDAGDRTTANRTVDGEGRGGARGDGNGEGEVIPFDELTKAQLVELLKADASPDMRHVADRIMSLDIGSAVSLLDMLDDIDSVAACEDIGRDLGLPKGIALVIISQLRRFLRSLKRRGAVRWPRGDGGRGREGGVAASQSWDSGRLVSAIEHEMGMMAADKKERHGNKLQHVIDKIKEFGISGVSMSLLVEPPQDSDGSDEGKVEAALIDAAREAIFMGISEMAFVKSFIRRAISRQGE